MVEKGDPVRIKGVSRWAGKLGHVLDASHWENSWCPSVKVVIEGSVVSFHPVTVAPLSAVDRLGGLAT